MAQRVASRLHRIVVRNAVSLAITSVVAAGVFSLHLFENTIGIPLLGIAENRLVDLRFALRGPQDVSGDVVVVAIDSKSVEANGRWPWDRDHLASLVDRLRIWGASAVVFEVLFEEPQGTDEAAVLEEIAATLPIPSRDDSEDPFEATRITVQAALEDLREDKRMSDSLLRTFEDNAALPVLAFDLVLEEEYLRTRHLSKILNKEDEQIILEIASYRTRGDNIPYLRRPPQLALGIRSQVTDISRVASLLGFGNPVLDQDGALRRERVYSAYSSAARHALESGDRTREEALSDPESMVQAFMPLAIAGVATHLRLQVDDLHLDLEKGQLRFPGYKGEERNLPFDPIDGTMRINYYGAQGTFPTYSFVDVIDNRMTDIDGIPLAGKEVFEGKLVFVGFVAPGRGDTFRTPFSAHLPGVERHANLAENLLHGHPLRRFSNHDEVVGYLALGTAIVVAALGGNLTPLLAALALAVIAGWGLSTSFDDFARQGLLWNWTVPMFTLVIGFVGVASFKRIADTRAAHLEVLARGPDPRTKEIRKDIFDLPLPIRLEFVTLKGKKFVGEAERAEIVRLSKTGGDMRTDLELSASTQIKARIFRASGPPVDGDLFAEIIDHDAAEGCVAVRFTSVPPAVEKHLETMIVAIRT